MPIKLDWYDNTPGIDKQFIYRSLTPINQASPGTPLAEVASDVFTYTDNTVVQGQLYYYAIASSKGDQISISRQVPIAYYAETGPGPQTLVRGDWNFGYFGSIPLTDIADATTIIAAMGSTAMKVGGATLWYKVAYKGKVLFVPNGNLATTAQWLWLYNNGFAYGRRPVPDYTITNHGNVAQARTISLGGKTYMPYLPSAGPDPSVPLAVDGRGGDVDLIMANLSYYRVYTDPTLPAVLGDIMLSQASMQFLTIDLTNNQATGTNVIRRGSTGSSGTLVYYPDGVGTTVAKNSEVITNYYRPIFEYVP